MCAYTALERPYEPCERKKMGKGQAEHGSGSKRLSEPFALCDRMRSHSVKGIASPQARENPTGGAGSHGKHAPSGPRREWRRRGRRRTPPLGAALARAAGIGAAPTGGARRRRDAAGRVGRGTQPGRLPSLRAGWGRLRARTGRNDAHDGYGAANSPPEAATRETDSWMGGHDSATGARGAHRGACRPNAGPKGGRLPRPR